MEKNLGATKPYYTKPYYKEVCYKGTVLYQVYFELLKTDSSLSHKLHMSKVLVCTPIFLVLKFVFDELL